MLPFDFDYHKPVSLEEAVQIYQRLERQGKQPIYFSGGTELITLGRLNLAYTEAVIDIKGILDLQAVEWHDGQLFLGSAVSLTKLVEVKPFPLLSQVASGIADHTARGKITLGGNVCARIFYREAALPFLLGGSQAMIAGPKGVRHVEFDELFSEQLQLGKGELVVQFITDRKIVEAPYFAVKRRQQWEIGYPLITITAVVLNGEMRVSVSGLCPFPFRLAEAEAFLNNRELSAAERIKGVLKAVPKPVLNDVEGSADYRLFVLENLLEDVLRHFEGVGGA